MEKESEEKVNNNNDNNTEASITSNPITDKISRPTVSTPSIKLAYYKQKASFITRYYMLNGITCVQGAAMNVLKIERFYNKKMKC